jgi:polysaccharide biosynthesis transport protein
LSDVRGAKARAEINPQIAATKRNLEQLPLRDPDRKELSEELQGLNILKRAASSTLPVVEPAAPSSRPISPRPERDAMLAVVVALIVGVGLAFLLEALDRRVRSPEEFEDLTNAPLLAMIPLSGPDGSRPSAQAAEAFQTLRASLTYFNIGRKLESVIVCSPFKGDGKTTVATNLALAVARTGKHVILVDTDLRHPQVAERLDLEAELGLADVLVGERQLYQVLKDVDVGGGQLQILPSGPPPPNPSELLSSVRMRTLLVELSATADLLIIDTPPALQVSDVMPLLEQASGVLVIGRLGKSTKHQMQRLMSVINTAGGSALGVVATGARSTGLYGYGGYGYYGSGWAEGDGVAEDGAGKRSRRRVLRRGSDRTGANVPTARRDS